jgi:hypothetical protein
MSLDWNRQQYHNLRIKFLSPNWNLLSS